MRTALCSVLLGVALSFGISAYSLAQQQQPPTEQEKDHRTSPTVQTTPSEAQIPVAGHPVASLKDVKKLYIAPMADDLDQYVGALQPHPLTGEAGRDSLPRREGQHPDFGTDRAQKWAQFRKRA